MDAERKILIAKIQTERHRGELLGPLIDRYGAQIVVQALGVMHCAHSLGVADQPRMDEDSLSD